MAHTVVTDRELDAFRRDELSPARLIQLVIAHVVVLIRVAVGIGKSFAVDALLLERGLYEHFDLVIYIAPAWDILRERAIVAGTDTPPVRHVVVHPRPKELCGDLDAAWSALEQRGCGTLAKVELCETCPNFGRTCSWPDQMRHLEGTRLVIATEQQFLNNRSFVRFVLDRTGAKRPLVIMDEAQLIDAKFELRLSFDDLDRFSSVVEELAGSRDIPASVERSLRLVRQALDRGEIRSLPECARNLGIALNKKALKIQEHGVQRSGDAFRYVGYDIGQLLWSRPGERWIDGDGVRFIARPYLRCHVLALSAHLSSHYVGHRLGRTSVESPFEKHRFLHGGTRIFNLRSRTGAESYFGRNHGPILDTIALLIARNIELGRSTLLISRKRQKQFCIDYLVKRLAGWGYDVRFVPDGYESLPTTPDSRVIPVLHYGILGVNNFTHYESAFCMTSYYVSTQTLNASVREFDAETFQVPLDIVTGKDRRRRARVVDGPIRKRALERLANEYLRRLEVDRVVQVVGRVRLATKAREVLTFQMADLSDELPGCQDVSTPSALREALALPHPREMDDVVASARARDLMAQGKTAEQAAAEMGISRRTLFRRLEGGESAKTPIRGLLIYRRFGTPPSVDGGAA